MKLILWAGLLGLILSSGGAGAQLPFPVVHDDMSQTYQTGKRPWQRPVYSEDPAQVSEPFRVPESFKKRVSFWRSIYSTYSTWQGVLHDALYPWIVYRMVDFSDIELQSEWTAGQKEKARRERVEAAKKELSEIIASLHSGAGENLAGEALSIARQFAEVSDENKFKEASDIERIRFQLGQRDRFIKGIYYSGRYIEEIEQIFEAEGLPRELTRLPLVESSFNIFAQSRVGASGLWQIMPRVGRENRLLVGGAIDERNDPIKASRVAAKILKNNMRLLDDWPLALTGYNHGVYGIRRRIQRSTATNLFDLVQERGQGSFGFASKNFYASFLAALDVEMNADEYFGEVYWSVPLPQVAWQTPRAITWKTLLEAFEQDEEMARIFNPHVNYSVRAGRQALPKGVTVYVPQKTHDLIVEKISAAPEPAGQRGGDVYRVLPGDTLSGIATKLGVSARSLQDINGISNPSHIRAGQVLRVP